MGIVGGSTELFLPSIRKSKPKLIELITSKQKNKIELLNQSIKERRQKETNCNIFTLRARARAKEEEEEEHHTFLLVSAHGYSFNYAIQLACFIHMIFLE